MCDEKFSHKVVSRKDDQQKFGIEMTKANYDFVLLLEDQPFIALDLEESLNEAGAANIVTLTSCEQADRWLDSNTPTLAIIDPSLKDGFCGSAARALSSRGIPFVVYSGDAAAAGEIEPAFKAGTWLHKPCLPEALFSAISDSVTKTHGG